MLFKEIKQILYAEDKDLFEKIFENGKFSYNEPIMIDQTSLYDKSDAQRAKESAERFGCVIDSNGDDIFIPACLSFYIYRSNDSYSEMCIKRNGESYYPNYIDEMEEINVELTELGKKLELYAKSTFTDLLDAYEHIIEIEKIFGVSIT